MSHCAVAATASIAHETAINSLRMFICFRFFPDLFQVLSCKYGEAGNGLFEPYSAASCRQDVCKISPKRHCDNSKAVHISVLSYTTATKPRPFTTQTPPNFCIKKTAGFHSFNRHIFCVIPMFALPLQCVITVQRLLICIIPFSII